MGYIPDAQLVNELLDFLIVLRDDARKEKRFAVADQVRNKLACLGVSLKDTRHGTGWRRKVPTVLLPMRDVGPFTLLELDRDNWLPQHLKAFPDNLPKYELLGITQ